MKSWTKIKFDIPDDYRPTYTNQSSQAQPLHDPGNLYVNNKLVEDLIILSGITSISNGALKGCASLTQVRQSLTALLLLVVWHFIGVLIWRVL